VRSHVASILHKLEVRARTQAVVLAFDRLVGRRPAGAQRPGQEPAHCPPEPHGPPDGAPEPGTRCGRSAVPKQKNVDGRTCPGALRTAVS
jgi:hypothetical protein